MSNKQNVTAKEIKVASVVDQYTVVLNVGSINGIAEGAEYLVYRDGEEVLDPDTGENLGALEIVVGRGNVTHLQEKIATLRSSEVILGTKKITRKAARHNLYLGLSGLFTPDTEEIDEIPDKPKPFSNVRVGDKVKRV